MPKRMFVLNRRDFLKLLPTVLGSVLFATCRAEQHAREITLVSSSAPSTLETVTFAETIFMNGKVITMDAADTIVQAVAIKDGLILKTGPDKAIHPLTGPKTNVIDLRGRTLTPGLIDAHIHPQQMGF